MTKEDLMPFCWEDHPKTAEPFSKGEFTYATNGHVLIRISRLDDVCFEGGPDPDEVYRKATMPSEYFEVPDPGQPILEKCDYCRGIPGGCDECEWTGQIEPFTIRRIGSQFFQCKYLRLLRTLPGVMIGPTQDLLPARFKFAGGNGLIMPCRPMSLNGEIVEP